MAQMVVLEALHPSAQNSLRLGVEAASVVLEMATVAEAEAEQRVLAVLELRPVTVPVGFRG